MGLVPGVRLNNSEREAISDELIASTVLLLTMRNSLFK